jgi:hypothetical protein
MCTLHLAAQIATRLQTHQRRSPIAATPHGSMSGISLAKHDDGGVCISPCSIGLLSFHTASREAPLGHVNTPRPSNLLLTNLRNRTKARRVCEFRIIDGKRGACVYVFVLCVINASAPMQFSLPTTVKCSSCSLALARGVSLLAKKLHGSNGVCKLSTAKCARAACLSLLAKGAS